MSSTRYSVLLFGPSNLGPYHLARYSALVEVGLDLTVVQMPVREHYRPWQVEFSAVLFSVDQPFHTLSPDAGRRTLLVHIRAYLQAKQPDLVIVTGYNGKYVWITSACCRELGIPLILYLVGWENERPRRWWKEIVKRWYCRRYFDGAMATGVRAASYAEKLGINPANIWTIGNVVDNDHFARDGTITSLPGEISAPYFLVVGRLSQEKNLSRLLRGFSRYRASGGEWHLAIAGVGPLEWELRAMCAPADVAAIHWLGWVQYADLPALYARAGCFILPSLIEPWGLVANEAMAAGLPVLISRLCGCVPELCRRGVNGFDFDPADVSELAELMHRISSPRVDRPAMGQASRAIIANYSLRNWSAGVLDCVQTLVVRRCAARTHSPLH